jgi:hypothetical protein
MSRVQQRGGVVLPFYRVQQKGGGVVLPFYRYDPSKDHGYDFDEPAFQMTVRDRPPPPRIVIPLESDPQALFADPPARSIAYTELVFEYRRFSYARKSHQMHEGYFEIPPAGKE